jgi:hypothetical protein
MGLCLNWFIVNKKFNVDSKVWYLQNAELRVLETCKFVCHVCPFHQLQPVPPDCNNCTHIRQWPSFQHICKGCKEAQTTALTDLESINSTLFPTCLLDENVIVTRPESCRRNWTLVYVSSVTSPHALRPDPNTFHGFNTYSRAERAQKLILYVQPVIFHITFSCDFRPAGKFFSMLGIGGA